MTATLKMQHEIQVIGVSDGEPDSNLIWLAKCICGWTSEDKDNEKTAYCFGGIHLGIEMERSKDHTLSVLQMRENSHKQKGQSQ